MKKITLVLISFIFFELQVVAQTSAVRRDSTSLMLENMSIEDLIGIKITVASKKAMTQKETPAIVSVITAQDIKSIGARDLLDILRLVPGVTFNLDVTGVVSWSMRGNWGDEGKILLLVDGQEMNEIDFATNYLGNRFDISQIKRVEIIRGPGSSIYGGYAELGVISIITKGSEDLNGIQVAGTYGQLSNTYGRRNISVSAGKDFNGVKISLAAYLSNGQRSNANYTDIYGRSASMKGNSNLNTTQFNLGVKYKGLSFRSIAEQYNMTTLANYSTNPGYGVKINYGTWVNELKYDFKLSTKLTLTPKLNSNFFQPYATTDTNIGPPYVVNFNRTTGGLHANYDWNDYINIIAGAECFYDYAINTRPQDSTFNFNNNQSVGYRTLSSYAQGLVKTKIVNFTAGFKIIDHQLFGSAFAPRIGLTRSFGDFHIKILYNRAFRTPTIGDLQTNQKLIPEITNVYELEAGYKFGDHMILSANLFYIKISNPIVYYVPPKVPFGAYGNFNQAGTKGIEAEYRYQMPKWFVAVNYSYYTSNGINKVTLYSVQNNPNQNLGIPQNKISLLANFKFFKKCYIAPFVTFLSEKTAYTKTVSATDSNMVQQILPATTMINLSLGADNIIKGLDIQLMAFNLLNQSNFYAQPYGVPNNPGLAPMPGLGREFVIRMTYRLKKG